MSENIDDIIKGKWLDGEEILWSHVVDSPRGNQKQAPKKALKRTGASLQLISFCIFFKYVIDDGLSLLKDERVMFVIVGLALIGLHLFWRTPTGEALDKASAGTFFKTV